MFLVLGVVLGVVLSWMAAVRGSRGIVWAALAIRLLLFVVVVALLARAYGPAAGLVALVASVVTRGALTRRAPVQ